jgi:hypothetical protein
VDENVTPPRQRQWVRWLKWGLIAVGLLVVAGVVAVVAIVTGHRTDCYAYFRPPQNAEKVLTKAHAIGLDDTDLNQRPRWASIRISSGETGEDAQGFRTTFRRLAREGGGHFPKHAVCIERPYFD